MHDSVAAEDEWVCVHCGNDSRGRGADMGHDASCGGGGTDGLEVGVMHGRVSDFVQGRVKDRPLGSLGCRGGRGEEGLVGCVPGHPEAVDIEELITLGDFFLCCCAGVSLRIMR